MAYLCSLLARCSMPICVVAEMTGLDAWRRAPRRPLRGPHARSALGEVALERRAGHHARTALQVLVGIGHEVGVQRADRLLHDSPHALAELAHHLHQRQPGERAGGHGAEVAVQHLLLGGLVEGAVDRQVAEVEEGVVHPGVLVVEQPQAVAVEQQVGCVQEILRRSDPPAQTLTDIATALADSRWPDPTRMGLMGELKIANAWFMELERGRVVDYPTSEGSAGPINWLLRS